jgi:hypothetical protein
MGHRRSQFSAAWLDRPDMVPAGDQRPGVASFADPPQRRLLWHGWASRWHAVLPSGGGKINGATFSVLLKAVDRGSTPGFRRVVVITGNAHDHHARWH